MTEARSAGSISFTMKPTAPRRNAASITSGSSLPESTTAFTFGWRSRSASRQRSPSIPGIRRSSRTTSGEVCRTRGSTCDPEVVDPTTSMSGASANAMRIPSRISSWSSAIRSFSRIETSVLCGAVPSGRRGKPNQRPAADPSREIRAPRTGRARRSPLLRHGAEPDHRAPDPFGPISVPRRAPRPGVPRSCRAFGVLDRSGRVSRGQRRERAAAARDRMA